MGNKKFKSLQLVRNGELKQALEEGASEVVPLETPQINLSESIQTNVKMMEKIKVPINFLMIYRSSLVSHGCSSKCLLIFLGR